MFYLSFARPAKMIQEYKNNLRNTKKKNRTGREEAETETIVVRETSENIWNETTNKRET